MATCAPRVDDKTCESNDNIDNNGNNDEENDGDNTENNNEDNEENTDVNTAENTEESTEENNGDDDDDDNVCFPRDAEVSVLSMGMKIRKPIFHNLQLEMMLQLVE